MIGDSLIRLIDRVSLDDDEIALLESKLDELKSHRDKILQDDIPTLLHSEGLLSAPLSDGRTVVIDQIINVSQKDKMAMLQWLRDNEYDAIVKTTFEFAKGTDTTEVQTMLENTGIDYSVDVNVHPMTLKSVIKTHLSEGGEYPPEDALKVSIFERAKIKEAK